MHVALVHDHLNQLGGAEKVLLELHKLFPDSPIFTLVHDQKKLPPEFHGLNIHTSKLQQYPFVHKVFKWYLPLMARSIEQLDLSGYDVIISSASSFAKGIRKPTGAKHICYCHTPTRYLWTFSSNYLDELPVSSLVKKSLPPLLDRLREWDYTAAQEVDYFIANSKVVADRIGTYYNREAHVIHPPVAAHDFTVQDDVEDYFVVLSRLRPYKKVDLAIQTFNKLAMPLKVLGSGEEMSRLKAMAGPSVELVGEVSEQEKQYYLSHARALLYPQVEDFGITAVEAMAAGRPVIAYQAGGALETIIPGMTGEFFTEHNWQNLAETVIRFDHSSYDPEIIREHALKFSNERFQKEIREFVLQHI